MGSGKEKGGEDKKLKGDGTRSLFGEDEMEQKIEREWRSIRCPGREGKVLVMIEWDVGSEKGRILSRSLRQIDCHDPQLTRYGGMDCERNCERVIAKRER